VAQENRVIVAGIGCRKGASAAQVAAAVTAALTQAGLTPEALDAIATPAAKGGEPGIAAAARALRVALVLVPQAELEAAGRRTATRSERVEALWNVPSVAEAAALAASGPGARLRVARCAVGPATCALAETEGTP
jgi:cobalt-precorrin 5A hydrolase